MVEWLTRNKDWVFSGIGVFVITLFIAGARLFITRKRSGTGSEAAEVNNDIRNIKDSTVYQAGRDINLDSSVKKNNQLLPSPY